MTQLLGLLIFGWPDFEKRMIFSLGEVHYVFTWLAVKFISYLNHVQKSTVMQLCHMIELEYSFLKLVRGNPHLLLLLKSVITPWLEYKCRCSKVDWNNLYVRWSIWICLWCQLLWRESWVDWVRCEQLELAWVCDGCLYHHVHWQQSNPAPLVSCSHSWGPSHFSTILINFPCAGGTKRSLKTIQRIEKLSFLFCCRH